MLIRRITALAALFLIVLVGSANAAVLDQIAEDFKPLDGVVIMPADGEFLIDLDESRGVRSGDLFAVVKPGEKIVHPVTGAVLGTLEEAKGLLRVTRTMSGYSHAEPLAGAAKIERGDVVRRYAGLPAAFWDYTGRGEEFFRRLQQALPALQWQEYAAAQAQRPQVPEAPAEGEGGLVFLLRFDGLEVRGPDFQVIHAYGPPEGLQAAPAPAPYKLEEPPAPAEGGVRYEAAFPGFATLGNLGQAVRMADFARDGERLLMADTDGKKVRVYAVTDSLTEIARADTGSADPIHSVRWWRPAAGGPLHLAVNTFAGKQQPDGNVFALKGDKLLHMAQHLPYFLGAFDRDGDGVRETLLGQKYDRKAFWGVQIHALRLKGEELAYEKPAFPLPRDFVVQGSLFADLTGDGRPETIFIRHGILYIYDGEKELYQSPQQMGGSLSIATYETNPNAEFSFEEHAFFEVPPVAADLDGDGRAELLAVAADRGVMSAPGLGPGVKKSWLAVFKYRDGMFVKGSLGEEMELPLQGLAVDGGRVLFVAVEPGSFFGKGAQSHVLSFPLAR